MLTCLGSEILRAKGNYLGSPIHSQFYTLTFSLPGGVGRVDPLRFFFDNF